MYGRAHWGGENVDLPTAVNFPRTWRIMATVIIRATMCMALAAPWNMIVFATSMFLAKQFGSMPTPEDMDVIGPTDRQRGSGAVWQRSVKSPKPICAGLSEPS